MLCLSIAPQSRQTAKVDLLNAARLADLIELRIDGFVFAPDVSDLVRSSSKPVIVACRRACDGGDWRGEDEDREGLLRRSVLANPAWIELDLELARRLPRQGPTKRLVTFVQQDKPLRNAAVLYEQAVAADADAVNFIVPMPTLEAAWPLLAAVSRGPRVPIVGVGLGACGLAFSLVSRKFGAPWIYAALERSTKTAAGEPTIHDLEDTYFWRRITRRTQFVGVAGSGATQQNVTRELNARFAAGGLDLACLPLELDTLEFFEKMTDGLKIKTVLPGAKLGGRVLSLSKRAERSVAESQFCDLMLRQPEGWTLYNTLSRAATDQLAQALRTVGGGQAPIPGARVLLFGANPLARALAYGLRRHGFELTVSSTDEERAELLAQMFDVPCVSLAKSAAVTCQSVVFAEELPAAALKRGALWQQPAVIALDVSRLPDETDSLATARDTGCQVLEPSAILEVLVDENMRRIVAASPA